MCGVVQPFHSSSLHHSLLLLLLSPTAAHSPVFHHTYPHFNCNHPIYCYLYPPLLLSLLLLLLLLWLELLSSCAFFFCFISMVLNIGFQIRAKRDGGTNDSRGEEKKKKKERKKQLLEKKKALKMSCCICQIFIVLFS